MAREIYLQIRARLNNSIQPDLYPLPEQRLWSALGGPGCGKTTLICEIMRRVAVYAKRINHPQAGRRTPGTYNMAATGAGCKEQHCGAETVHHGMNVVRMQKGDDKDPKMAQRELDATKLAAFESKLGIPAKTLKHVTDASNLITSRVMGNVIIIDEQSTLNTYLLGTVHQRCQQVTGQYNVPFGGLDIILVGDDFQLPPVGGELLGVGMLKSVLSFEFANSKPAVNSPKWWGRALMKRFKRFTLKVSNRGKHCQTLQWMNAALRDVTKDYPITQTWINCLKEITAETIIEEPGFLTATIS